MLSKHETHLLFGRSEGRSKSVSIKNAKIRYGSGKNMSLVVRKPVIGVADKVRHKPVCTATEDG